MTGPILCVLFSFLVLCFSAYSQEIYRWVDEEGNIHFTTTYDRIPEQYRSQVPEPVEKAVHKQNEIVASEEEVTQFFAHYRERYARRDIEGFLSLFSSKAVQNERDGFDDIKKIYSDFFDKSQQLRYRMEDTRIEIYQNAVHVRSHYKVDQILKKGRRKKVWAGDIRWILIRENGALKIRYLDFKPEKSR